jgi:glucose/arabinose dehydrogenase
MTRVIGAIIAVAATIAVAAACVPPASLSVSTVVGGLNHPWDVAWTPDGTMLFTQRPGAISARVGGQTRQLADPSDVDPEHERGMMGLAVDPQFSSNRFIYTCFASDINGPTDVRLARWKVDAGYTLLSNRTDIISGIPVGAGADRHVGCRAKFGPDGYLWVTTGDGTIGTAPQDKHSLAGKVLRVDRNGNGAPGNPGGAFLPQIYTYGHRNPQGIGWRPYDGKAFAIEHGTGCDDEINLLVPGGNYGWDPTTPDGSTSYTESRPMTDKTRHPGAIDAVWRSGCPTIAPSGGTFIQGEQWKGWNQALAVAVLKDEHLHVFGLDADGKAVDKIQWERFKNTYGRLRTAVQGPNGDLYILTDENPGAILRVHPSG